MRAPRIKPHTVQCFYGPPERGEPSDVCYQWGARGATKRHANALAYLLGFDGRRAEQIKAAFEEYGFDITTLRVSIEVKPASQEGVEP